MQLMTMMVTMQSMQIYMCNFISIRWHAINDDVDDDAVYAHMHMHMQLHQYHMACR